MYVRLSKGNILMGIYFSVTDLSFNYGSFLTTGTMRGLTAALYIGIWTLLVTCVYADRIPTPLKPLPIEVRTTNTYNMS